MTSQNIIFCKNQNQISKHYTALEKSNVGEIILTDDCDYLNSRVSLAPGDKCITFTRFKELLENVNSNSHTVTNLHINGNE